MKRGIFKGIIRIKDSITVNFFQKISKTYI